MKALQLLPLLLAFGCAQAPAQNNQAGPPRGLTATGSEQQQLMDRIEREVQLPQGAGPLASYARSYAWQQSNDGGRKVLGYYENLTGAAPGRRWVTERDFPGIMDGGCGVIRFSYDPATHRFENLSCNGYA